MAWRKGKFLGAVGPFNVYETEEVSSVIPEKSRIPRADIFISSDAVEIFEIYFTVYEGIIKGKYTPIPNTIAFLKISLATDLDGVEFETVGIKRIIPDENGIFEIHIPITKYYTGWVPYFKIEAYITKQNSSGEYDAWDIDGKLKIRVTGTAESYIMPRSYLIGESNVYNYIIIHSLMWKQEQNPAIIRAHGQIKRLIIDKYRFFKFKDPVHRWFLVRRALRGPYCPAHRPAESSKSMDIESIFMSSNSDNYLYNIGSVDNPFCSMCYGTGIYGAFDTIIEIPALVPHGVIFDAQGNEYRPGSIYTTAMIKVGDYVTNLRDFYVISGTVEARVQLGQPIWYTASVRAVSPENPVARAAAYLFSRLNEEGILRVRSDYSHATDKYIK